MLLPYHELAQAHSTHKPSELRDLVKYSEIFTGDDNMGLAKRCLSSLYKKRLTKTFLALSLQDVASRVQLWGP